LSDRFEYLDAGIFIAGVDKSHVAYRECEELLLRLMSERRALTSLATLEEVLHRIRAIPSAEEFVITLLRSEKLIKIPLTIEILKESTKLVFKYQIDAFDAIAITTALKHGAVIFWTVDTRLMDCVETLKDSWIELSRIQFKCPVSIDKLREESRRKHLQKAKRNVENAILNLLYARGLKMRKKNFLLATDEAFKLLEDIISKYSAKPT